MKTLLRVALFASLVSTTVLAHHGNAAFDVGKKLELKGTVTEWIWANPHCWLKFDVKGEDGKVVNWVAETTNSADMTEKGWSKLTFKVGDPVTVTDPKLYTKPWVAMDKFPMKLQTPDYDVVEMLCAPSDMESYKDDFADPASGILGK